MEENGRWDGQSFEIIYRTDQNQTPLVTRTNPCLFLGISAPESQKKLLEVFWGVTAPPKREKLLASEAAVGMFLRLQKSLHLKNAE